MRRALLLLLSALAGGECSAVDPRDDTHPRNVSRNARTLSSGTSPTSIYFDFDPNLTPPGTDGWSTGPKAWTVGQFGRQGDTNTGPIEGPTGSGSFFYYVDSSTAESLALLLRMS
ncbi:hypothetical protein AB1Y20_005407 [Prymnesium parvum]|uniref:Uncharacterized protein n=1 Tax=Prymnesium parvum TaxID=97485 RepID=A0AB34J422_PRYPA